MPRRITVLLVAVAGLCLVAAAPATAATKRLRIVGGLDFKPGKSVKDTQRFAPGVLTVDSGDRVVLRNRSKVQDPHTISVVRRRALPNSFECPACDAIFEAHGEDPTTGEPVNPVVDVGDPGFDRPGDSIFIPPGPPGKKKVIFRVTADEGDNLSYLCGIHPWMQGRLRVR